VPRPRVCGTPAPKSSVDAKDTIFCLFCTRVRTTIRHCQLVLIRASASGPHYSDAEYIRSQSQVDMLRAYGTAYPGVA
jgi:hypothetical protein